MIKRNHDRRNHMTIITWKWCAFYTSKPWCLFSEDVGYRNYRERALTFRSQGTLNLLDISQSLCMGWNGIYSTYKSTAPRSDSAFSIVEVRHRGFSHWSKVERYFVPIYGFRGVYAYIRYRSWARRLMSRSLFLSHAITGDYAVYFSIFEVGCRFHKNPLLGFRMTVEECLKICGKYPNLS